METFTRTNSVKVAIDGDESKVIEFNPNDMLLRKRITEFMLDLQTKQKEMAEKAEELDKMNEAAEGELPSNLQAVLDYNQEVADYFIGELDDIFGKGASAKLFGERAFDPDLMAEFLSWVMGKINGVSQETIEKKLGQPLKKPRSTKKAQ